MAFYNFRICQTCYYLHNVTDNDLAYKHILPLSADARVYYLTHEQKCGTDFVAVIVGDRINYDKNKRCPYEFASVEENVSSSADKIAIEHTKAFLSKEFKYC